MCNCMSGSLSCVRNCSVNWLHFCREKKIVWIPVIRSGGYLFQWSKWNILEEFGLKFCVSTQSLRLLGSWNFSFRSNIRKSTKSNTIFWKLDLFPSTDKNLEASQIRWAKLSGCLFPFLRKKGIRLIFRNVVLILCFMECFIKGNVNNPSKPFGMLPVATLS